MRTINREIVGAFIFSNDGYMVLGRSKPGGVYQGYMTVPGGGVELGETNVDALQREVLEEIGVDIHDAKIVPVDISLFGESEKTLQDTGERVFVHMHFNNFFVTIQKPAAQIMLKSGDDFADAAWVPVRDLPSQKLIDASIATLKKLGYV